MQVSRPGGWVGGGPPATSRGMHQGGMHAAAERGSRGQPALVSINPKCVHPRSCLDTLPKHLRCPALPNQATHPPPTHLMTLLLSDMRATSSALYAGL